VSSDTGGFPEGRDRGTGPARPVGGEATVSSPRVRLTVWVEGFVQGVGFRWWTRSKALELGLVGSARNLTDGRVAVVAEGDRAACEALLAALRGGHAPGAVRQVVEQWTTAKGDLRGFHEG
jgi:acylphosphatase